MRKISVFLLLFLFLLTGASPAQESSITNLSVFQDGWGNTGGFWLVKYGGEQHLVFKIKNHEKGGAADIVFTQEQLQQFEEDLLKLKQSRNTLKDDGFKVFSSISAGESVQNMVLAQLNGVKIKTVQVIQHKAGEAKQDHHIGLSTDSYYDLKRAIKKVRRKLKWQ